jgi:outer membrane protein assembly factor BamB
MNVFLFGTDHERVLTLTDTAGFAWIRQQVHWRDHEFAPGDYNWQALDRVVKAARAHDMQIMLSVVRSPTWATASGNDGLPEEPEAFANFLGAMAERYAGVVSAYQVWNEPNLAHENGGTPATPAQYLALLEAAYPAVKAADPCALVVSAALAATNAPAPVLAVPDLPFFEALYTLDDGAFLRSADVVALHTGAGPHAPDAHWPTDESLQSNFYFRHLERTREIMQRHGDPRQVWISEVGWSTYVAEGAPPPVSEEQQAAYLTDVLWYVRQHYPWISAVFVWNLNFAVISTPEDEKATFSLLNADWHPRPAYFALQTEVHRLNERNQPPVFSPGADYTYAWSFHSQGKMRTRPLISPDGTIYVASDPGHLYALAQAGGLRWSFDAPADTGNAPARAPDGTLYLGSVGVLTAVQPDGTPAWTIRARGRIRGSPIYHNGLLLLVTRDGEIQAFDAASGQEVWWYTLQRPATYMALDPAQAGDRVPALLVGTRAGTIYRLRAADGEVLWSNDLGAELRAAPTPTADGRIYVVTEAGQVVALDSSGSTLWQTDLAATVVAPALVSDGSVYVAARDGTLSALDAVDGRLRWRYASGSDMVATPARGPDGTLYVGTDDERLLAIAPDGRLRWQVEVVGMVRSQPTLASDGMLYITTVGGRVYAFEPIHVSPDSPA